jgi:hypothetical protein
VFGRRISVWAILAGLLLPAVVGCLLPSAAQAQAMDCCAQVTCAQGHSKQACFSTTAPTNGSQSAPEVRTSLVVPAPAGADVSPVATQNPVAWSSIGMADAPPHSPPELYTLYLSLLI